MSRESRQHFLHRIGKRRGNTTNKTSSFRTVRHDINSPERCLKNRCWLR
jgi:hypothetical protein